MKEGSAMIEILAVDDDREILAVIQKALSREGYGVTTLDDPRKLEDRNLGKVSVDTFGCNDAGHRWF